MKFNIECDGKSGVVTITQDGNGGFVGTIESEGHAPGVISKGVEKGNGLSGDVLMDGHKAHFQAVIAGDTISGRISALGGWINRPFSGRLIA